MNTLALLLATGGAALLLGAGALLRAPTRRLPTAKPDGSLSAEGLALKLEESVAAQDGAREETIAMRQRLERQIEAAEAEVQRLSAELAAAEQRTDATNTRCESLERLVEGVRARSRELSEELKTLKGSGG